MKKKFLMIIVLGVLIPVIVIGISLSVAYYRSVLSNSYNIIDENMETHIQVIDERLNMYKRKFYEIVTDTEFISMAKQMNSDDVNLGITAKKAIANLFSANIYAYKDLNSMFFLADSGTYALYSRSYGASANSTGVFTDPLLRNEISEQVSNCNDITFFSPFKFNTESEQKKYMILMAFPIRKMVTQERYGVLLFVLDPKCLLLDQKEAEDSAVSVVVTDKQDIIQASADKNYINLPLTDMIHERYGSYDAAEMVQKEIPGTDWKLVSIVNSRSYMQEMRQQMQYVIAFVMLLLGVIIFLVFKISNRYVKRIENIADEISTYETGKMIELHETSKDELNVIVDRFNQMSQRNLSLITEMQSKNEEIVRMTKKQRDAQIKALEAQINPHFLYNTLDAINWRAIENDEEEISNMISMLASLLRYSVSNIDKLVILRAEIEWLKKYMFLQQDRFGNSFDWEYEATEEAMDYPIYKMLLQPLMENAILHAFEDMKSGGEIKVHAFVRRDGRLEISVKDNGKGMKTQELELIRKQIEHKNSLDSKSIGISNVINRLWTYYGEAAEIYVDSKWMEGTEFVLVIPTIKEDE